MLSSDQCGIFHQWQVSPAFLAFLIWNVGALIIRIGFWRFLIIDIPSLPALMLPLRLRLLLLVLLLRRLLLLLLFLCFYSTTTTVPPQGFHPSQAYAEQTHTRKRMTIPPLPQALLMQETEDLILWFGLISGGPLMMVWEALHYLLNSDSLLSPTPPRPKPLSTKRSTTLRLNALKP